MSTPSLQDKSSRSPDDDRGANSGQPASKSGGCGPSNAAARTGGNKRLWAGRILTALAGLFLLFDAAGKLMLPKQVIDASVRLGLPVSLDHGIGVLLLVCTLVYLIPRSAVLGAVMLTGYLGGAVAIQMRAGSSTFETVFPVLIGVLVWAGIYLRECRLCGIFPLRR